MLSTERIAVAFRRTVNILGDDIDLECEQFAKEFEKQLNHIEVDEVIKIAHNNRLIKRVGVDPSGELIYSLA